MLQSHFIDKLVPWLLISDLARIATNMRVSLCLKSNQFLHSNFSMNCMSKIWYYFVSSKSYLKRILDLWSLRINFLKWSIRHLIICNLCSKSLMEIGLFFYIKLDCSSRCTSLFQTLFNFVMMIWKSACWHIWDVVVNWSYLTHQGTNWCDSKVPG